MSIKGQQWNLRSSGYLKRWDGGWTCALCYLVLVIDMIRNARIANNQAHFQMLRSPDTASAWTLCCCRYLKWFWTWNTVENGYYVWKKSNQLPFILQKCLITATIVAKEPYFSLRHGPLGQKKDEHLPLRGAVHHDVWVGSVVTYLCRWSRNVLEPALLCIAGEGPHGAYGTAGPGTKNNVTQYNLFQFSTHLKEPGHGLPTPKKLQ